jgi:hypothetical protein
MIDLKVKTTGDNARTVKIGPADLIRFERKYGVGVSQFSGEGMRYEWLAYLAWTALTRDKATTLEFDPWLDTVEELMPVEVGNDNGAAS